ncbi:DUF489 family protein [Salinisphaera sp. USBA-960]|uniref:DUF489 family protein n=1 Tax=Salinisphaera orenii TaxID=856731 RepID=UPI000DBE24F8|nr:DUF489 family protein [Salifodinibacter halophilus]NNC25692.1 DUF489 family protein [Salifodinibacter halophilus]
MNDAQQDVLGDQILALAGVCQFALYAHELAVAGGGYAARHYVARQVIFATNPETVGEVFGETGNLKDGLAYVRRQLTGKQNDNGAKNDDKRIARYIGQVLKLASKLRHDDSTLSNLSVAIDRAKVAPPANATAILNTAYQNNISPLRPRIVLQGNRDYLGDSEILPYVRLQLLAAVRCGILWRQCGGRFPSLFLRRRALLAALERVHTRFS